MAQSVARSAPVIAGLTAFTMVAFAANSLLGRLAMEGPSIDPASFTAVRLMAGALMLWLLVTARRGPRTASKSGNWTSAVMLFIYAAAFSFAYLSLATGTGALILFGSVQVTMLLSALWAGERPTRFEWVGLIAALVGLVYLVSDRLTVPSPLGGVFMALAGIAWGIYTLRGRGTADPLADTAGNFLRSVPLALVLGATLIAQLQLSAEGLLWAVTSGALASGLGYALWYSVLPHLTATRAATVQLSVPVIAAVAGVLVLSEAVTFRLVVASVLILGGIGLAVFGRRR
ncbi:DMT family transporter [Thiohalomonas denitrificans]|uniref:Threonine/homoserine efflux transporter RhtA n=1 Tax=Thiohalomonas denitrificans TaxID=415747 RepID=A0A1G5QU56_9GAMM|nr:DMT family transporter [Thiohalomonas denitrificans]SCZ65297.1 Threonine/homoserine efflux transporter RhtA [Thiohalomonas denitrificans]